MFDLPTIARSKKRCPNCDAVKPMSSFLRDNKRSDKRQIICKVCTRHAAEKLIAEAGLSGKKKCPICKVTKRLKSFHKNQRSKDGRSARCKPCVNEYAAKRYSREYQRERHFQRYYGLDPGQYARMVAQQGGHCALCGREPSSKGLCVDHDHVTKKVRALLCHSCNVGIGMLQENADLLRRAIDYLEKLR